MIEKWKVIAVGVLVLGFLGFVFFTISSLNPKPTGTSNDNLANGELPTVANGGFRTPVVQPNKVFPEGTFAPQTPAQTNPDNQTTNQPAPPANNQTNPPVLPDFNNLSSAPVVDLNELQKLVTPITSQPQKSERLDLPAVDMSELAVDQNGAGDFYAYMDQIISGMQNVTFSYEKFNSVSTDVGETILFPENLIDKILTTGDFAKYKNSISVMKEFSEYKLNAYRAIKVHDEALDINKVAVGFEKLTVEMLQKALDTADGKLTVAEFKDYYARFNNTANYYHNIYQGKYGSTVGKKSGGFFQDLAETFGLIKIAHAFLPLPFGGLITFEQPCTCSFGLSITVGPPVPGKFFISAFGSIIFAFFKPFISSWILGNYSATPMTCLQIAFPACVPTDYSQGVVIIAGTS